MTNVTDKRWLALILLCLGDLMIILDTTIVNVALPSIRVDLGFSETSLVWVINAYMLAFSGFLLLGGRLGDLYGNRKIFVGGVAVFTVASLLCGLADSQFLLIAARALQGLGGAVVSAIALSLIVNLFTEENERAKAMGYFGFIAAGGGAIGVFLGGFLTGAFDWHSVFLVNLPIGIGVIVATFYLLPKDTARTENIPLDFAGAVTVTLSLMLAVYSIVSGNGGWNMIQTYTLLASLVLFGIFLFIESKIKHPLMPLTIFSNRNVAVSGIIGVLWSAGMFAWFFLSALYLQLVLGYSPLQVGLSFLPGNLIMAAFSLGLSAWVVKRFGLKKPIAAGMALITFGLLLFMFAPVDGTFLMNVLPGMLLLGFGAGIAFNPSLLAGMSGVPQQDSGLASGVLNTAFMMGGSLGLAILASIAASHTSALVASGVDQIAALNSGYHIAFGVGAAATAFAAIAAIVGLKIDRAAAEMPAH